jgi:hypothetical protein
MTAETPRPRDEAPTRCRRRLGSAPRIRREAVRLHRRWDAGELEAEEASRMIDNLGRILAMVGPTATA